MYLNRYQRSQVEIFCLIIYRRVLYTLLSSFPWRKGKVSPPKLFSFSSISCFDLVNFSIFTSIESGIYLLYDILWVMVVVVVAVSSILTVTVGTGGIITTNILWLHIHIMFRFCWFIDTNSNRFRRGVLCLVNSEWMGLLSSVLIVLMETSNSINKKASLLPTTYGYTPTPLPHNYPHIHTSIKIHITPHPPPPPTPPTHQ